MREMPDGATCQNARNARRRDMPDGATCQTARNAERRLSNSANMKPRSRDPLLRAGAV
jgi:hypothetical protein